MKIALEIQPALNNRTGIGWYTYEIVKRLRNGKDTFHCFCFNFLGENIIDIDKRNFPIDIEEFKLFPYSIYTRLWDYIPISYNHFFKQKVDIIHFFNYIVPPNIKGKIILTVYDMVYKNFRETMTKKNYNRLEKNLSRSVNRADLIITISENSKNEISKYLLVDKDKIKIVYPGVEIEKFNRIPNVNEISSIREKYNLPTSYILYLGTIEPRKNIKRIIDSFYIYKQNNLNYLKLVIAGKKGWMFDKIFDKINKYGIIDDIIFTGYVDEGDKPFIYKLSKVFVFPSLYEGFGMPVLEAMAASAPVITSNSSSLPEVAGDAAILVDPYDIQSIAKAMEQVVSNDSLREDMIKKGLKQCLNFTWEKSIEKLYKIYSSL